MVYIDRNGRVYNDPPFFYKLTQLFWGILNFFYAFFVTMFPALEERSRKSGSIGGSGNGRGPPGDRPPRRLGQIHTLPPPPCGPSGG